MILYLKGIDLKSGNLIEVQEKLYESMKDFSAFLILLKTNFGKVVAYFYETKFESTRDMSFELDGIESNGKLINN